MKSMFFGLNAKLALAVLAVGTMFTGCYEEKGIDVTPVTPPSAATYTIYGNVYSSATSAPVAVTATEVTMTVTPATVAEATNGLLSVDGSSFKVANLGAESVVVIKINKNGYFPAQRTISVGKSLNGTAVVVNADIVLTSAAEAPLIEPEAPEAPVQNPGGGSLNNIDGLTGPNGPMPEGTFTNEAGGSELTYDENGEAKIVASQAKNLAPISVAKEVSTDVVRFISSFVLTDVKVGATAKALADVSPTTLTYLVRCVANATNMPYAGNKFMTENVKVNIWQAANKAVIGVKAVNVLASKSLTFAFEGKIYSVEFMSITQETFGFMYDTHDSHDSHDGHDGHGGNPNAGGGMGGSNL